MKTTTVPCRYCSSTVTKPLKEVTRSLKRGREFFCGISCAITFRNNKPQVTRVCGTCGSEFLSSTKVRAAVFCSRSCASKGSVTDARRASARTEGHKHSANLIPAQETLKRREAWKYADMETFLKGVPHEFEYKLGDQVFDLRLGESLLVEFDGAGHSSMRESSNDGMKDAMANLAGYKVVRIPVKSAAVIPFETVAGLVA